MAGIILSSESLLHLTLSRHARQVLNASHSTRVDVPKGDPRDPMTEGEIAVKFTALGGDVIGQEQCKKLQSFIMRLETAESLGGLFELTTAG